MFSSLKIKTFFFLTLLMATTACLTIIFTHRDVGNAMLKAERSSAINILELVELNIRAGYVKLLSDKLDMIAGMKWRLNDVAQFCLATLNEYADLSEKRAISEKEAKSRFLNWYPRGLKKEEIPLVGRIACICDVFDALISERPYKTAWPIEKALDEIQSESGSYFDPRLVTLFMEMETDLRRIVQALGSL